MDESMKKSVTVCSGYRGIDSDEVQALASARPADSDVLWRRRNVVWRACVGGTEVVVKSFGSAFMGKAVYALRASKAQRSYEYALEIRRRGFDTPAPIGYTESRGAAGALLRSAYICEYIKGVSLADGIRDYGEPCIKAFAAYVVRLHKAGIRHDDLNCSNVRVERGTDGEFAFSLIDLNRMRIYPEGVEVPMHECFESVSRFTYFDDVMRVFAQSYAEARGLPANFADVIIKSKADFDRRFFRKKKVLHALGRVIGIRKKK